MNDRELRDELERLYAEVKAAKAELERPGTTVAEERARFVAMARELEEKREQLEVRRSQARARITEAQGRRHLAEGQLDVARSKVGELENLGNPLERAPANWETPDQVNGCGLLVLAVVCAAIVATWLGAM